MAIKLDVRKKNFYMVDHECLIIIIIIIITFTFRFIQLPLVVNV